VSEEPIEGWYYAFDCGGFHFVILDACFRSDGNPYCRGAFAWTESCLPDQELAWLQEDLVRTPYPVIIFVHQRLDADPPYGIVNTSEVRSVLAKAGNVRLVLHGHEHPGDFRYVDGIPYCTLSAMLSGTAMEGGAYGILEVYRDGVIQLQGYGEQPDYELPQPRPQA
jgi:alkaline phosphatase